MTKIKEQKVKRCIVKESKDIRSLLEKRFKELSLTGREIVADANKRGQNIGTPALCRYRKSGNIKGTLSQEDIIWLCYRYGIGFNFVSVYIEPYIEKDCLKRLKTEF